MELRHLRYFVAVAEEENVTRAAARLHLSQPPLTRQIRDLEHDLGVELFTRTAKSIRLTEAGRVFLGEARAVLQRADEAKRAAQSAAAGEQGEMHLGYAPSPTAAVLPALLRLLKKQAPGLRVTLHDHSSPEMLAGLRECRLHAALMTQPSRAAARGIAFEKLRAYPIMVAVAPEHAWAKRRSIALTNVLAEPLVVYASQQYSDYHEFLERIAGPSATRLRFAEQCDSGTSLIAAIEAGKGPGITPSILKETAGRRLRFIPIIPAPAPAVVGIAYRAEAPDALTRLAITAARTVAAG